jgi:dynactin-6
VRADYVGVEAASIGDYNTFKPKSKVSSQIAVSDHCTFGPGAVTLASDPESTALETLGPYTVVYGSLYERRKWDGSAGETERAVKDKEREYLREIMPK